MSALTLRIIACVTMFLDHLGYCIGFTPFRMIGRISFPLYVFLIINGYLHTKNRLYYAARIGVMALISQLPFSLFETGKLLSPKLNVMFSLLLVLLAVWAADTLSKNKRTKYFALLPALVIVVLTLFEVIPVDYGPRGVLLGLVFWYFKDKPVFLWVGSFLATFLYPLLLIAKFCLFALLGQAIPFPVPDSWTLIQLFSLLCIPFIQVYNNQAGYKPQNPVAAKALQYGFYWFYPVHILVLALIF